VVGGHPPAVVCQTFRAAFCDLGVRGGEGKKQLGVVCIAVIGEDVGCDYRA